MIRMVTLAAASALVLGTAACKESGTSVSNNVVGSPEEFPDEPGVANLGDNAVAGAQASASPEAAVSTLAASDLFEIESARLAQQKGQSSDVKGLADMIEEEHAKASNELKAILAESNPPVAPPTALPTDLQARLDTLKGLSGAEFDKRWLAEQQASHQETLAKTNAFLAVAQPGPLKDHASKATGMVQKHLNELNGAAQ
jgi:putative membrane protein